jgi:hypothetical protein
MDVIIQQLHRLENYTLWSSSFKLHNIPMVSRSWRIHLSIFCISWKNPSSVTKYDIRQHFHFCEHDPPFIPIQKSTTNYENLFWNALSSLEGRCSLIFIISSCDSTCPTNERVALLILLHETWNSGQVQNGHTCGQ